MSAAVGPCVVSSDAADAVLSALHTGKGMCACGAAAVLACSARKAGTDADAGCSAGILCRCCAAALLRCCAAFIYRCRPPMPPAGTAAASTQPVPTSTRASGATTASTAAACARRMRATSTSVSLYLGGGEVGVQRCGWPDMAWGDIYAGEEQLFLVTFCKRRSRRCWSERRGEAMAGVAA